MMMIYYNNIISLIVAELSKILLLSITVSLIIYWIVKKYLEFSRLPPGPIGYPFVGVYPHLKNKNLIEEFNKICQTYGSLSSFHIGANLYILVADYDLIKEMFQQPLFSGRSPSIVSEQLSNGCGVVFTEGPVWRCQRQASIHILKDAGFAKSISVSLIIQECNRLVSNNLTKTAKSHNEINKNDLYQLLLDFTSNVIGMLTFGDNIDTTDPDFDNYNRIIAKMLQSGMILSPRYLVKGIGRRFFPILLQLPKIKEYIGELQFCHEYIEKKILKRKLLISNNFQFKSECLCDGYILKQMEAEKANDFETYKDFQLVRICLEFFIGGSETTANMIQWLLVFMAAYPEVQMKVHNELDNVVGSNTCVTLKHMDQLHYVLAVIDETFRKSDASVTGVPHRAMMNTTFKGYDIPSDANILPFLHAIHTNPKCFPDPHSYKPERFINDKNCYQKSPYLIPFLIGQRKCPGKTFAKDEISLVFVMLMQKFTVSFPEDVDSVDIQLILKGTFGTTNRPNDYRLIFGAREFVNS